MLLGEPSCIDNTVSKTLVEIVTKYGYIFEGLGTFLGDPYHSNLDTMLLSKQIPCQPAPCHQQDAFKKQLADTE